MNAYICVYRQINPPPISIRDTANAATKNSHLQQFLNEYQDSFYDWGDDPSFFSAKYMLSDVNRATWGVCRRDVRADLEKGDVVVFFCGSETKVVSGL